MTHPLARTLFGLITACSAAAQTSDPCAGAQLTLIVDADSSMCTPPGAHTSVRGFQGLVLGQTAVRRIDPLVPAIFFDSGSPEFPDRYEVFTRQSETETFSDSTLDGDAIHVHRHILNIIGYRMRMHPDARIEIAARTSYQVDIGEAPRTAEARAANVREYLVRIWSIDSSRIALARVQMWPEDRRSARDILDMIEKRRVEIRSNDWTIMKPVEQRELSYRPWCNRLHLRVDANRLRCVESEIEISRNGIPILNIPLDQSGVGSLEASWPDALSDGASPADTTPYRATLITVDNDGRKKRASIEVPVRFLPAPEQRGRHPRVDQVHLIRLGSDTPPLSDHNKRVIREYLVPSIERGAGINVAGHTDVVGAEDRNRRISELQAAMVADELRKSAAAGRIKKIGVEARSEQQPMYSNATPEGRWLNRAMLIIVRNP